MSAADRLREMVRATGPRIITAAHPAAAAAGAGAFSMGGNAFDAALAACFVEHIALPMKCGLAGDLVALVRRAGGPIETLVSVGPGALALDHGARMERLGPASVGIPGAPHGFATLHGFARLDLARLAAPAQRAAEAGMPWTRIGLGYLRQAQELLRRYSPGNPYTAGGLPEIGDRLRLPGLGRLLEEFVRNGAALFEGEEGERIIAAVQAGGGFLTMEDLRCRPARLAAAAEEVLPDGSVLRTTPSPTGGPRLVSVIKDSFGRKDALLQTVRAERMEAKRRGRLALDAGTSVVTAADDAGNAVVVVHSNSFPQFGSGVVLDNGLVLSNRPGRGFDPDAPPGAANAPASGRTPSTTLHAWSLQRGEEMLLGATPGGVNQLPWNSQMLHDLLGGADIATAVSQPRWSLNEAGELTAEEGLNLPEGRAVPTLANGSAQQILRLRSGYLTEGVADPRVAASALAVF
ncbi:gamma-glutamyltransferase [Roseomonas chloroacetimidivorans]|uniref:gamma-glutamyltransferase n=1 Tax=Roseomonas chloroacetimidivorans TaxID=1766656 RepID=UPI003C71A5EF